MLLTLIIICLSLPIIIGWWLSTRPYEGPKTDHFDGSRFFNPNAPATKGFADVVKWLLNREKAVWHYEKIPPGITVPKSQKPIIQFVNHSTFLIQVNKINILTDPVWSERVSPFSFMGPKRQKAPGILFDQLPCVDLILLSHNHYDHLDISTLLQLQKRDQPLIVCTLGVRSFLEAHHLVVHAELDWWAETDFKGLKITCTRAQHFSGRGFFDRDKSLWGGYSIKSKSEHILFLGDTGYGDFYKSFPSKLPPIDLAIIPIGAFQPTWFMHPIHCSPSEAVQIHLDLQAKKSIACHFGTFPLGDDGPDEAVEKLQEAKKQASLADETFLIMQNGDSLQR